jgi:hypothetical protein
MSGEHGVSIRDLASNSSRQSKGSPLEKQIVLERTHARRGYAKVHKTTIAAGSLANTHEQHTLAAHARTQTHARTHTLKTAPNKAQIFKRTMVGNIARIRAKPKEVYSFSCLFGW